MLLAIDPVLQLAHSICSGRGIYAVLLGSGVSRGACIPTGWEVTLDLVHRLAALEGEDAGAQPGEWFRNTRDTEPSYSFLLGALDPRSAGLWHLGLSEVCRACHAYFCDYVTAPPRAKSIG
jgi:hypothetical protein